MLFDCNIMEKLNQTYIQDRKLFKETLHNLDQL